MDEKQHAIHTDSAMLDDVSLFFAGAKYRETLFGVRVAKVTLTKSAALATKNGSMAPRADHHRHQGPFIGTARTPFGK